MRYLALIPTFALLSLVATADEREREDIRFVENNTRTPDEVYQRVLREGQAWQSFREKHGQWYVQFNEENAKPHRAFGKPISVPGIDARNKAENFIQFYLQDFDVDFNELNFLSAAESKGYFHVNFEQYHKNLEVLFSNVKVKLTKEGKVVLFGLDVYNDISIALQPSLDEGAANAASKKFLNKTITKFSNNGLKILPVPTDYKKNNYYLVYEVLVETRDENQIVGNYYTLIDAHTGKIWYRDNQVRNFHGDKKPKVKTTAASDINVKGTLYPTHNYASSASTNLPNLRVNVGGQDHYTDSDGNVSVSSGSSATIYLEGPWVKVTTGGSVASFNTSISSGSNNLTFTAANIRELSAFYSINQIHDYKKSILPSFTGMDFPITAVVDKTGTTCNASYSGSALNFYAAGGGCNSLATVHTVVYHEYAHGINHSFWSSQGSGLANGAIDEGYADVWSMCVAETPLMGIGYDDTDPNYTVRRFDQDPKQYPKHIRGEVHYDGEIITGVWWDVSINLNNDVQKMAAIFTESLYGVANGANGTEGQVFTDVLIDALNADDIAANGGDGDITNGTPNDLAIAQAFARHGITLLTNTVTSHTPVLENAKDAAITVTAKFSEQYAWAKGDAKLHYRVNRTGAWKELTMNFTGADNYQVDIPAQPEGVVVAYYLGLEDINGQLSAVHPERAHLESDINNIPYYILVGFNFISVEDFDYNQGSWKEGVSGDNATAGNWIIEVPVPSYRVTTPSVDVTTIVQPGDQFTPGGTLCAVTGNASSSTAGLGAADIDAGQTTLESPKFDLSSYENPVFTYRRWYANDPAGSANAANDHWKVLISNDGGSNWTYVERTRVSDYSWRRFAFRVKDYLTPTANTILRFVAEDTIIPSLKYSGGGITEAALDDLELYDAKDPSSVEENDLANFVNVYPNPATDFLNIRFDFEQPIPVNIQLLDALGRVVHEERYRGNNTLHIPLSEYSEGLYSLSIQTETGRLLKKLTVLH